MNIGVDLDDVVGNTLTAIIAFYNEKYGTTLKREDFLSCHFWETWGGTRDEAMRKMYDFFETDYFENIVPVSGSARALKLLKENGNKIFLVTGRPDHLVEKTKKWTEKYFPNIFDGLYFANSYSLNKSPRRKADFCKDLGATLLIEDDMDHIKECFEAGLATLLFNQPWNQGDAPPNAKRVFSWDEVVKEISN